MIEIDYKVPTVKIEGQVEEIAEEIEILLVCLYKRARNQKKVSSDKAAALLITVLNNALEKLRNRDVLQGQE